MIGGGEEREIRKSEVGIKMWFVEGGGAELNKKRKSVENSIF